MNNRFLHDVPITWSTFCGSIWSNPVWFHTYFELPCLSSHSWIKSFPSSLSPILLGYSGSDWFWCRNFLRPPPNTTSMPLPWEKSTSCLAVKFNQKHEFQDGDPLIRFLIRFLFTYPSSGLFWVFFRLGYFNFLSGYCDDIIPNIWNDSVIQKFLNSEPCNFETTLTL